MSGAPPGWVWLDSEVVANQYVELRLLVELSDYLDNSFLRISAVTNFVAYVNDELVGTGQFSDFPEQKTFSEFDVAGKLQPGENVLCILAHYCGVDTHSYLPGQPGIWFELAVGNDRFVSSDKCLMRLSSAYKQHGQTKISCQMGFVFEYDASRDDGWRTLEFIPGDDWRNAVKVCGLNTPVPRPLKQCVMQAPTPFDITAQGVLKREESEAGCTVAELMLTDYLSVRRGNKLFGLEQADRGPVSIPVEASAGADGFYLVIDMAREECGFITLELDTAAGTVVDVAVGEHLADLRVRASVDGKINYASRYITAGGRQSFSHCLNRYSGRYLQLHFTNISAPVTVIYAGLIPFEYPLNMAGRFSCPDSLSNRIYDVACRTLHLCIHEHYEDTPWREQALYANDSRNQALTGYYTFGEYDVPRVSFAMLAETFRQDGFQELCAPMKFDFSIPSFTLVWFMEVWDHLLYSGAVAASQKLLPAISSALEVYAANLVDDLLPCPQGIEYWQFYDWSYGLNGVETPPWKKDGLTGVRFDAPLNLYYINALRSAARIFEFCGDKVAAEKYQEQAKRTAVEVKHVFRDQETGLYRTFVGDLAIENHFAELTQSLAILTGVADQAEASLLQDRLICPENGMIATTLSQSLYKFEAILAGREQYAKEVFAGISRDWGSMLYAGATSFWETLQGQADFQYAGSLCHGWSAIPAYMFHRYILGVSPLEPGFTSFQASPMLSVMDSATGSIPTPYGPIAVSWSKFYVNFIKELLSAKT